MVKIGHQYHATWVIGHEMKMEVLKKAQEGWENLMIADEVQTKGLHLEEGTIWQPCAIFSARRQIKKRDAIAVVKLGVGGGIGSMLAVAME